MTPDAQNKLDGRLIEASKCGHTETVQTLLAAGADVHSVEDLALRRAAYFGHTETVEVLLAHGANVHARGEYGLCYAARNGKTETVKVLLANGASVRFLDDGPLRMATYNGHTETVQVLALHIFTPDSWRGKSRAAIEAAANALYDKIKAQNPQPDRLRTAGVILIDCAMQCWEQVRPPPPKLQISPLPAQARPL